MNRTFIAVVVAVAAILTARPSLQAPEPIFIPLTPQDGVRAAAAPYLRGVTARTIVGLRIEQLFAARRARLNVAGHDWIATLEAIDNDVHHHRAWVGSIEGIPYSHVSIVERAGVVSGTINAVGTSYSLRTVGDGLYALDQLVERPDDIQPVIAPSVIAAPRTFGNALVAANDDAGFVDVLLVYTPGARDYVGGHAPMAATIAQVISDSNTIFNRSGVHTRLRLVGTHEWNFVESPNIVGDLAAFSASSEVNSVRDSLGADVVLLLEFGADLSACGVGYLYQGTTPAEFPAFSISAIDCVSQYTPTHEIGHTMGSHHNPENAGGTPLFSYSYGYRDASSPYPFRTVMSYTCSSVSCPRIASFSNPDIAHQESGRATGTAVHNNALSLNNAAALVANFRPTRQSAGTCSFAAAPPWLSFAPSSSAATVTLTTQAGCAWTAASADNWVSVSPASGSGPATLTISVAANGTGNSRSAIASLGDIDVSLTQSGGCAYALDPLVLSFEPSAGTRGIGVGTAPGCAWSAATAASWLSVSPASGVGPGLVTVQATSNPGRARAGTITVANATASVEQLSPLPVVAPPVDLREVSIAGNRVTLAWTPGFGQLDATAYVIEGGLKPGEAAASLSTGTESTASFTAPDTIGYVRVRAFAAGVLSAPSNEIRLVVNVPAAPSAPVNLLGAVNGNNVYLSWTNTFIGGTPTSLRINVTGSVATSFAVPPTEMFAIAGVPAGNYAVSLTAINAQGSSVTSNVITLQVPSPGCATPPQVPSNVQVIRVNRGVTLQWEPPEAGGAITSYAVRVSGALDGVLHTTERVLSRELSPGTYIVQVSAVNPCGTSALSAARAVVIP